MLCSGKSSTYLPTVALPCHVFYIYSRVPVLTIQAHIWYWHASSAGRCGQSSADAGRRRLTFLGRLPAWLSVQMPASCFLVFRTSHIPACCSTNSASPQLKPCSEASVVKMESERRFSAKGCRCTCWLYVLDEMADGVSVRTQHRFVAHSLHCCSQFKRPVFAVPRLSKNGSCKANMPQGWQHMCNMHLSSCLGLPSLTWPQVLSYLDMS